MDASGAARKSPVARNVPIDQIIVVNRIRKGAGDVTDLCESIKSVGLLHPVVLTEKLELVAGLRRMAAFERLERETIPAVIVSNLSDAASMLHAERDENECRKPFSVSEAVAMGKALEAIEAPLAKERKREAAVRAGKISAAKRRGESNVVENLHNVQQPKTREVVGDAVGMSGPTYSRAKIVIEAAQQDPETFGEIAAEMEQTGKVNPAYNKVREIKSGKRPEPKAPSSGKKPVGVLRANEAIDCLMRIPKNDPHRKRAFQIVTDWIKHNKD